MQINKKNVVSAMMMLMVAGSAHAFEATLGTVISPVVTVARLADSTVFGPTLTSVELSSSQAAAIVGAHDDAVNVIKGRQATDAFLKGRASLEEAAKIRFKSDKDAAVGIIEIAGGLEAPLN